MNEPHKKRIAQTFFFVILNILLTFSIDGQKWMENSSGVPNPFPGFPGYVRIEFISDFTR